ncbi:hypothetical protein F8M41_020998 [Gigaspora margarita]|uniref:Uncharacterized protein n=1 Tax=Gigaspora margarita TaxID=4874 RepID=A0A8H4B5I0_GIGMA|nr:hypothetical protein F8M41_020998 [Gigaspora margarita]
MKEKVKGNNETAKEVVKINDEIVQTLIRVNNENLKGYSWEVNHGEAMEKLEICDYDVVHDECKVDYNGIEAADGKVNDPKNRIRHQYGIEIKKDEV